MSHRDFLRSRKSVLVAFLTTVAVAVPAGWRSLTADIRVDGKHLRPLQSELEVEGVRVTLAVDRPVIYTGDSVVATLRAYADTPKQVTVDLVVLRSSNYEGGRVETPSVAIDHEKLVLAAAPNGGPVVHTKIAMGTRPKDAALVDNFRIVVTPHGATPTITDHEEDPIPSAVVGVLGWSGSSLAMTIQPEGTLRAGEPGIVVVRVKNTTGRAIRRPYASLRTQISQYGYAEKPDDIAIANVDDSDGSSCTECDDEPARLAPGAVAITKFTITLPADARGKIGLLAQAFSYDGEPGPAVAGAMDVKTVDVQPAQAPSVAVK